MHNEEFGIVISIVIVLDRIVYFLNDMHNYLFAGGPL